MSETPAPDVTGTVFDEAAGELARTYADALLGAADNEGQTEAALGELDELLEDIWRDQPKFRALLTDPALAQHEKDRLIVEVFEGRALPVVCRFLRVLNRHGRLELLPAIVKQARDSWDRRQNRIPVTVRSAVPLDDGQMEALRQSLGPLTGGATPIVTPEVDPSLIGGLVVQIGDHVYDASVRSRLQQLRSHLAEAKTRELQGRRAAFQELV